MLGFILCPHNSFCQWGRMSGRLHPESTLKIWAKGRKGHALSLCGPNPDIKNSAMVLRPGRDIETSRSASQVLLFVIFPAPITSFKSPALDYSPPSLPEMSPPHFWGTGPSGHHSHFRGSGLGAAEPLPQAWGSNDPTPTLCLPKNS